MTEASVQNVVLFNEQRGDDVQFSDDELVESLTDAVCAILRVRST